MLKGGISLGSHLSSKGILFFYPRLIRLPAAFFQFATLLFGTLTMAFLGHVWSSYIIKIISIIVSFFSVSLKAAARVRLAKASFKRDHHILYNWPLICHVLYRTFKPAREGVLNRTFMKDWCCPLCIRGLRWLDFSVADGFTIKRALAIVTSRSIPIVP